MVLIRMREPKDYVTQYSHLKNKMERKMIEKCFLETHGYQVLFKLNDIQDSQEYINMVIELRLDPHIGDIMVRSISTFIALNDLRRLASYFAEHIARLQENPDSESDTFVPMELGFQVQALAGEVTPDNEGEFSIRFLLNVGQSKEDGHRVYIGGESVTKLANIKAFIAALHEAFAALSQADGARL